MNIAFWIIVILIAVVVWVVACASMFSARVGKVVKDTYDSVKDSMDVEEMENKR